jgi:hypothetical protein
VVAKSGKLADPEGFHFPQPASKLVKRFLPKLIDPHSRVFFNAFFPDQAASPENPQMAAERGRGKFERSRDLSGPQRPVF